MTDFNDLDHDTRSFALVGQFLRTWALMEISLQQAIGEALRIESTKLEILSANLAFYDKLHILRTLVDVSDFTKDQKTKSKAKLRKLGGHSKKRNMIAHELFAPDVSGKGVQFHIVKARGEFTKPLIVWMPEQFERERATIEKHQAFLDGLTECFKKHPIKPQRYVEALIPFVHTDWPVPMLRTFSPALWNFLNQPVPVPLGSGPTKSQASPQTPEKPQE